MIPFFRKIRYKLAADNQFLKYSRYAIGEILLIVVGILIALQINNWNEEQKQEKLNNKLSDDIKITLIKNYENLNWVMGYNQEGIMSARIVMTHLEKDLPYHDSLDLHFSKAIQYGVPNIRNSNFENLKIYSQNLRQIDALKEKMNDVYSHTKWMETVEFRMENYFNFTVSPALTELFETVAHRTEMKPFNYEDLKYSNEYKSILNTMNAHRKDQNHWYLQMVEMLQDLEEMIEENK